jgi:RNA polymerase primary sigma factor
MYMREMGSVELLTREGEIEIAKRIEEGLKHMIMAISACPTTIAEILETAGKVARDEMRIDELVDGLIDPNATGGGHRGAGRGRRTRSRDEESRKAKRTRTTTAARGAASLLQLKVDALERFARSTPVRQAAADAGQEGPRRTRATSPRSRSAS